jgi:RNA polymerase sigma factor (sigma-70 family)
LKDYYDDSDIKFSDVKIKKKDQTPMNRGTPSEFVEIMLESKEAKQKMVQCNMRLVVSISKRYKHVGVNVADLVQEGSIGLTRAAEKFDPKKGFKFSTYASWWIQQAVFRSIAYHSRTIRLPVHVHNLLNRVRRVRAELKRVYGRSPTNEEMAAELDMSVEKFVKMLRLTRQAISLDMAKYQNNPKDIGQESETSLGDTIDATDVIKDENSPQQNVDRTLFRDDLQEMLKILGEDERRVICARYGINDGLTRTVTTVAAQLGQTKSWVRSQECRALRKLRRPWYEKRLWEHQNSLRG